jgi:hypothetical protein
MVAPTSGDAYADTFKLSAEEIPTLLAPRLTITNMDYTVEFLKFIQKKGRFGEYEVGYR